ncbi:arylamine N-acetyltransferase [bacterium SGD-2]|jgi:Arylamine N-acetyltransferase|nr:arylamine N-acetyltransferase [bacterium SGD-2]
MIVGNIDLDACFDLGAYFRRIGFSGTPEPTLETLKTLHLLHPLAIPFENLDSLLGRPVRLDLASLQAKLVGSRRGGYCYEHNTLFMHVLTALGFRVTGLAARVMWNYPAGEVRPRTHMLLRIEMDGAVWIADVGFGGITLTAPLRLEEGTEQPTPHETFRLERAGGYWILLARIGNDWRAVYRFDLDEHRLADYEITNYYLSTHPQSAFVNALMAARPVPGGRHALLNRRLNRHGENASQQEFTSPAEVRAVLQDVFGIDVPPGLEEAMERKGL